MADITVISVGTLKESYLRAAVDEYKKRIGQFAKVDEINLKEETIHNESDSGEISAALKKEGEKILFSIPKDSYTIAACVEGVQYDSVQLAGIINDAISKTGKICIIIGSSHGLSDEVKKKCALKLSISKLTFPHQLIRPVLLEVIYRSFTIINGKKYHK